MEKYIIESDILRVVVTSRGCEIISVVEKETGREYMWSGNPESWKRHAPVLFPLIGRYKNDESIYENKTYHMTQHGFARDMEFQLVSRTDNSIKMSLVDSEETKIKFPFAFKLILGYEINDNIITATYEVENTNDTDMSFSIGGHPAFACPTGQANAGCQLMFYNNENRAYDQCIKYGLLNSDGLLMDKLYDMHLENDCITITRDFFDKDAYIFENYQCNKVALLENGKPIVTVEFDAPVFGIWSAAKKDVPFVCIEPWYGRTDKASFTGTLADREWGNVLKPDEIFNKSYTMTFGLK